MEQVKIKVSDLPRIRQELLDKQGHKCPITGRNLIGISSINLCVDHDHMTGVIRGVLPRGINGLEGKVLSLLGRFGGYVQKDTAGMTKCLRGLADYLDLHKVPQTNYIHHTHKTSLEKRAARNSLARKRYAASKK